MRLTLSSWVVLITLGVPLLADGPKPIELTIMASAIETPVLKYRLFPSEAEMKPGNAVPILLRLPWDQRVWMTQVFPTLHEWGTRPLNAPEWGQSKGVLPESFYVEMKRAAFRREASWEYPIGETSSPYSILLPDVQELSNWLGRGLSARIRYHISRGELDKAREGIMVGIANSRHIAHTTFYINQMVAISIHRIMLERVNELISQPDSPNLYWALSALPDSLLQMDRAADFESDIFALTFPAVRDFDRPRDANEWKKMARQLVEFLEELDELPRLDQIDPERSAQIYVAKMTGQARSDLLKLALVSPEKVAQMTDHEAVVRWYTHWRISTDERVSAVLMLPPREAWRELKKLQTEVELMQAKTGTQADRPNPTSMYLAAWTLKRRIQALRLIEAIRDHLATHDGQLPELLKDIHNVAIPVDPITNQPFIWSVNGKVATLASPPLPADVVAPGSANDTAGTLEYRLRVKTEPALNSIGPRKEDE